MELKHASNNVLNQLIFVLSQIHTEDYIKVIPSHNASAGQHIRHIIDFYLCLLEGLAEGTVNYDQRKRDHQIENNVELAIAMITEIKQRIKKQDEDIAIDLEINYSLKNEPNKKIKSSYLRELSYNIEHAIHHMAIIRAILHETSQYIEIPENFGISSSTVRFRNKILN